MSDPIIQRIEAFRCGRGQLFAERRNRGYTLYHANSGAPVARLRPTGRDDRVEVLYWSLSVERWKAAGPFGRTVLSLDDALQYIEAEVIFWAMV
jgi:hypothetical protein